MPRYDLVQLVEAVQSALLTAQAALQSRHEAAIERLCGPGGMEAERSPVFSFPVDRGNPEEVYRVPVASLRAYRTARVARLSLEFDCELRDRGARGYSAILRGKGGASSRKGLRHLQIVLAGEERAAGQVRLDGELLWQVPPYQGRPRAATAVVKSGGGLWQSLLNWWRRLWARDEVVLTREAAERAKEIARSLARDEPRPK